MAERFISQMSIFHKLRDGAYISKTSQYAEKSASFALNLQVYENVKCRRKIGATNPSRSHSTIGYLIQRCVLRILRYSWIFF